MPDVKEKSPKPNSTAQGKELGSVCKKILRWRRVLVVRIVERVLGWLKGKTSQAWEVARGLYPIREGRKGIWMLSKRIVEIVGKLSVLSGYSRLKPRSRVMVMALGVIVLLGLIVPGVILLGVMGHYWRATSDFDVAQVRDMKYTSFVYDRHGEVIQRLYDENRLVLGGDEIPEHLKKAVIAVEDQRFYSHWGFDLIAILRAAMGNFWSSHIRSGASTITQQLARNTVGMFERTLDRKLREAVIAFRIEQKFSKKEILTLYLNRIYFGRNFYGVGAAAEGYFGKHPKDLTVEESALLAGMIAAPNIYSPWFHKNRALGARRLALKRMREQGFITKEAFEELDKKPIHVLPPKEIPGSYVISAMRQEFPDELTEKDVFQGGLSIYTTIDLQFQRMAEKGLEAGLSEIEGNTYYPHPKRRDFQGEVDPSGGKTDYLQGAFVALSNRDAGILAVVGGRDHQESNFNRAIFGRRQVGSSIKPFVYTHAFNVLNITGFTEVNRAPFDLTTVKEWPLPEEATEYVSVREALRTSNNYCAMRVGMAAGLPGFSYLIYQLTGAHVDPFPSSLLGTAELTPYEMASAYTVFPNGGKLLRPHIIESIKNRWGEEIYRYRPEEKVVLSQEISFQMLDLMRDVVEHGTGAGLKSRYGLKQEWQVAGKTGTTDDYKDCWFVGYSTDVTAAVWVGLDEPKTIMPSGYSSRVSVPVWGRIMKDAFTLYPPGEFHPPEGVRLAQRQGRVTREYVAPRKFLFFNLGSKKKQYTTLFSSTDSERLEYIRRDQEESRALARIDNSLNPAQMMLEATPGHEGERSWKGMYDFFSNNAEDKTEEGVVPVPGVTAAAEPIEKVPDTPVEAPRAIPVQQ